MNSKSTRQTSLIWLPILFSALLIALLVACGAIHTNPDAAPAYSEVGYNSVEATLCGKHLFGVGGCTVPVGTSATLPLTIQGFLAGEIGIFSDLCHVDFKIRYKDSEQVTIPMSVLLGSPTLRRDHSCTFRVVVSPDVIEGSTEKMWPRTGQVYLEVIPTGWTSLPGEADQVRASENPEPGRQFAIGQPGDYLLKGCGADSTGKFEGDLLLPPMSRSVPCKYQLAIKTADGKKFSWVFLRTVYKTSAELLPLSSVSHTSSGICVDVSPEYTTFLAVNLKWKSASHLCSTDRGPWAVRVFTTKRNSYELVR